ncbi:Nitrate transporter 1.5 [Acorus calamus]|uniref:Nitrate transporter 1.5 n=1 Tax=Acorus calamus TaxID=4465 RepID=A0AAV9DRZ6_ACOCL|nr:Nitrate transporter 1.5 [Acorus calamus]
MDNTIKNVFSIPIYRTFVVPTMIKQAKIHPYKWVYKFSNDHNFCPLKGVMQGRDPNIHTMDGTVDRHSQPSIKRESGGWLIGYLLLVNQALVTLAMFGVGVNLVSFMTDVLDQDKAKAANSVSNWSGTAYMFSLVGAFLSDSYWGRYKTCAIFQVIFVAQGVKCNPLSSFEIGMFYVAIYQIALGNGGYQPAITTFGADQFDEEDPQEALSKVSYFSYFYLAMNLGTLISNTVLVYIEEHGDWVLGFWISTGSAFAGLVLFLAGAPWYRHFKPSGNPISRFSQVIVAASMKWRTRLPSDETDLYETDGNKRGTSGGRKILHTTDFRFLDKAAVVTPKDSMRLRQATARSLWHLCPVAQVEEVKCIIRLLPIWLCTIIYSVVYAQMASVFIEQGDAMKFRISRFHIASASMSIFEILGVSASILLYRLYLVPLYCRFQKGDKQEIPQLQRMGFGLLIAVLGMVSSGLVEFWRLRHVEKGCDECEAASSLSILWQIPQYALIGISEAFTYVSMLEFFNKETPDGLKSIGSALYMASMALGNYTSTLLVTLVMKITGSGEHLGWIPDDLNKGHLDRFYYLLAALAAVDLVVYVTCAKCYKCISLDRDDSMEDANNGRELTQFSSIPE